MVSHFLSNYFLFSLFILLLFFCTVLYCMGVQENNGGIDMGIVDKKEKPDKVCVHCGGKVEIWGSTEISEGWLCRDCCKKCGYNTKFFTKKKTLADVKHDMEVILAKELEIQKSKEEAEIELQKSKEEAKKREAERQDLLSHFQPTKKVLDYIAIDQNKKQWTVGKLRKNSNVYNFKDMVNFELIDLGSAKECSMLRIKISIANADTSSVDIKFFESGAFSPTYKRDSFVYRTNYKIAQECLALLHVIKESNHVSSNASQMSGADEILKFKNLLDSGIITQEEFEAKKKQLLNI